MKLNIITGTVARPQRGVLYAPEGIGKSTLASLAPAPLFLDFEKGTHHLNVARVEPKTLDEVHAILDQLGRGDEGFQTLVVDTIDWLEECVIKGVCAKHSKTGLEDFGYGKGYVFLAEEINLLLAKLDRVAARMNVIMLAHSEVKRQELPDLPPFDRYQLRLAKSVMPLVKEWADWVAFGNYETILKSSDGEKAKAVKTRSRQLWCSHSATADAKNRVGLSDVEPWGIETLNRLMGASQRVPGGSPPPAANPPAKPARQARKTAQPAANPPAQAAPVPPQTAPEPANPSGEPEDHVPGLDTPAEQLAALLVPITGATEAATAWCRKHRRIQDGQTYRDADAATIGRILANPQGFLAQLTKEGFLP